MIEAAWRPYGPVIILKTGVRFQVGLIKVGNLGAMHKIRIEGDHQPLTFGVMQLVDAMQHRGAKVNISWVWINWPPILIL